MVFTWLIDLLIFLTTHRIFPIRTCDYGQKASKDNKRKNIELELGYETYDLLLNGGSACVLDAILLTWFR